MWSLGFGLEKIGLAALRFPILFTLLVVAVSAAAAWSIPSVRFDGNVTAVLAEDTKAFREFFSRRDQYRDSGRDVALIIRSDRLMSAEGLEDLRTLQLDLSVTEGVASATSLFSLPRLDPQTGDLQTFFPEFLDDDKTASELVADLLVERPQANALISPEHNAAVIQITLEQPEGTGRTADSVSYARYANVRAEARALAPADFEILFTGMTPLGLTIVEALVSDQLKLTVIGLLLGTGIGLYVFGSLWSALICAIPPALTALWVLALFSATDTPLNYLTTVLPTLALILAFADGIVLYFRWQKSNVEGGRLEDNLRQAIVRVGPASSLTSITTALAFYSFSFASSSALKTFAYLGAGAVAGAFLAVIIGMPLAAYWAIRAGLIRPGKVRTPAFTRLGERFHNFVAPRPVVLCLGAIAAVVALGFVHNAIRAEYRITDYLPFKSDTRTAERLYNDALGGASLVYISVPMAQPDDLGARENRELLSEVEAVLGRQFAPSQIASLNAVWQSLDSEAAIERIARDLQDAAPAVRSNYISNDSRSMQISVRISSGQSINTTGDQVARMRANLAEAGFDNLLISGLPVLMAEEFTRLINQLRTSLLIAIFLGITIIGVATRSPIMALAAATPNLLPILTIELFLYMRGGSVNMSEVISLTVAFGIAVDNAVHVINMFEQARRAGMGVRDGVREAMREVGPALGASTMILCVATLVTQISSLPMVPILGRLMIATLVIALISNLAILPSNVLALREWIPGSFGRKTQKATSA